MSDLISRKAAIDAFGLSEKTRKYGGDHSGYDTMMLYEIQDILEDLPPAQSEVIHCNACKHWTQTTGKMQGFGIGNCDFMNAKFVNCNAYCYWAERRESNG